MRIWSIHPRYLDSKGLVASWRETLLAKKVLENKTKGYKHHPQLDRFRRAINPLACINQYLFEIYKESERRNFRFDKNKFNPHFKKSSINVTKGQMDFEMQLLKKKLKLRDIKKFREINRMIELEPHPLFRIIPGPIEPWERI